jgi:large subunit ribosomal protein L9
MRVILLDNVIGLGRAGDIKAVKDGYARNYLIPKKFAEIATKGKETHLKLLAASLAQKAKKFYEDALTLQEALEKEEIEIKAKAGEEGKLFGSITNTDIATLLKEKGFDVDKKKILSDHLKTLGEHPVKIRLDEGVTATIKIKVIEE